MSIVAASTRRYKAAAGVDAATRHTLSFWAKTSGQGAAGDATLSNVGTDDFAQFYIDSGQLAVYGAGGGQAGAASFSGMDFYTILWPVVGGEVTPELYLNASSVPINGSPFPWPVTADPGSPLWFLSTPGGEQPPDGWEMANVILNAGILTVPQIIAQMASEAPVVAAAGWWKCRTNLLNSIGGGPSIVMDAGAAGFGDFDPFPPAPPSLGSPSSRVGVGIGVRI